MGPIGVMRRLSLKERLVDCWELSSLLCLMCERPLIKPRQSSCGDRICSDCYNSLLERSQRSFTCQLCGMEGTTNECFRDRAAEIDLKIAAFPCLHPSCPWSGSNVNFRDHVKVCKYAPVRCPHPGCDFVGVQSDLATHTATCPALPVKCTRCSESVPKDELTEHTKSSCSGAPIQCTAGCGCQLPRRELSDHLEKSCPKQKRPCTYSQFGCLFEGDADEIHAHDKEATAQHLELVSAAVQAKKALEASECVPATASSDMKRCKQATDRQIIAIQSELSRLADEVGIQIAPLRQGIMKLESSLFELQEGFAEMALMVQSLQATSYNGEFIWKIPVVARRIREAQMGKTISLYSAPFFTSRFGYKLCLRLYLNGDGVGKGTHLSLFFVIMKGEYDNLLSWPFQQMVTLTLLDQDKGNDIIQAFHPEPASSSFLQPKMEMNVASGCPKFAPLSVLDNPSYVRNDTLILKVIIDKVDTYAVQHLELISSAIQAEETSESSESVPAAASPDMRGRIMKFESSLSELREVFLNQADIVKSSPTTSHNGEFFWKMAEEMLQLLRFFSKALFQSTTGFLNQSSPHFFSFLQTLKQIAKQMEEDHYNHLLRSIESRYDCFRTPVEETREDRDNSLLLLPAKDVTTLRSGIGCRFCYLVAPIPEIAKQPYRTDNVHFVVP